MLECWPVPRNFPVISMFQWGPRREGGGRAFEPGHTMATGFTAFVVRTFLPRLHLGSHQPQTEHQGGRTHGCHGAVRPDHSGDPVGQGVGGSTGLRVTRQRGGCAGSPSKHQNHRDEENDLETEEASKLPGEPEIPGDPGQHQVDSATEQ